MRGNRCTDSRRSASTGSIPARAGKPWPSAPARELLWVYPRACGETCQRFIERLGFKGLSPRVRGNPSLFPVPASRVGSIPARAGKPFYQKPALCFSRVYPRACGETVLLCSRIAMTRGLSPRVRGNLPEVHRALGIQGSIPARAGEPTTKWTR